jgi:excisionase family DNA binding protein
VYISEQQKSRQYCILLYIVVLFCAGGMNMEYYTPQEVADKLKVDIRTVYRWIREGRLKAAKVVTLWRIPKGELERLLGEGEGE